ncbi:MAG: Trehalose-phosphate phosphatase [Candidatus Omnitrophica bacterium]|nr:Trehalose-phosphate phosphatase [Candidatus Omnitrophota bacterium]
MKRLKSGRAEVLDRLRSAKRLLLLLDFDGTLSLIVADPKAARMEPTIERVLRRLARTKGRKVAVISGRALRDLRSRVRVPGAILIGNHGLESTDRHVTGHPEVLRARHLRPLLDILHRKLHVTVGHWPGVRLEHKGWTLSVHYRGLSRERRLLLERTLSYYRHKASGQPLIWRRGKQVLEVRPDVRWDKGRAAERLYKSVRADRALVCGDDRTDEDMFRQLRNKAVTVRVGRGVRSHAQYRIEGPRELAGLLEELC